MSIIKKYKWFIISVILLLLIIGKLFGDYSRAKRIIEKSDKKVQSIQIEIDEIKKDRSEILIEKRDIEKRYEEIRRNPPIKKVPVVKYKTIEKIKYVKSDDYEETERNLDDCILKFNKSMDIFNDLGINYDTYIFKTDKVEEKIEEKSDTYKEARDDIGGIIMKKWSLVLGPSVSISTDGVFRFSLSLTLGKKII
jgi:hypothetical protein